MPGPSRGPRSRYKDKVTEKVIVAAKSVTEEHNAEDNPSLASNSLNELHAPGHPSKSPTPHPLTPTKSDISILSTSIIIKNVSPSAHDEQEHQSDTPADEDDRSSSLSDIEDRTAYDDEENSTQKLEKESDREDTEAETERLEETPQKQIKRRSVVLGASRDLFHPLTKTRRGLIPSEDAQPIEHLRPSSVSPGGGIIESSIGTAVGDMEPTSDISSLSSGDEANDRTGQLLAHGKKRKRVSQPSDDSEEDPTAEALRRVSASLAEKVHPNHAGSIGIAEHSPLEDQDDHVHAEKSDTEMDLDGVNNQNLSGPKTQTGRKGKRKGRKPKDPLPEFDFPTQRAIENGGSQMDVDEPTDALNSDGEVVGKDAAEELEESTVVKNEEESNRKKTAMDALLAIEKDFSVLKHKLLDEQIVRCDEELAMFQGSAITHPDYLAMKACVDQRRKDKIEYQRALKRYKLDNLHKRCDAERAQMHCQYMQTVRDVRDRILEQASKEMYQIQRERRICEGDVPEYVYQLATRRSQQIIQQTAYNTEVSILSGIAKYVGFPAAPDIAGARPNEADEDFQRMGIRVHAHNEMPATRQDALSGTAGQRRPLVEPFSEMISWANPQPPGNVQHHSHISRQVSQQSRPRSPFVTPAPQRRIYVTPGSSSAVVEPHSGPSVSLPRVPIPTEQQQTATRRDRTIVDGIQDTPSRPAVSYQIDQPRAVNARRDAASVNKLQNPPEVVANPPPTVESHRSQYSTLSSPPSLTNKSSPHAVNRTPQDHASSLRPTQTAATEPSGAHLGNTNYLSSFGIQREGLPVLAGGARTASR